jgi:predicted ArsR family transcriptional regulator
LPGVKVPPWRKRVLESTRGQILSLLRTHDRTVDELATQLGLTDNAVRAHLISLERDGFVAQLGRRAGSRKPHVVYTLTSAAEHVFPKSYGPLLDLVLGAMSRRLEASHVRRAMREVGRKIAVENATDLKAKSRQQRIDAALGVLSDLGGAATFEKVDGTDVIRGRGCPISAATANHPAACLIAESLLSEIIGTRVKEHCRRGANPSCCFEIG